MIPISFKPGVVAKRIHPRVIAALVPAAEVWEQLGAEELLVTSLNDGHHRKGSYHYQGRAADLRTRSLANGKGLETEARNRLAALLGDDFDVVLEALGTENEHIHVELDPPKGGTP